MTNRQKIDEYWESPKTASLIDKNLRILETDFVLSQLSIGDDMADIGCGDAESTVHYAKKVGSCLALERSATLRNKASQRFLDAGVKNYELVEGDALDLSKYKEKFNVVVSQRVVINFMTWEEQKKVIQNIWETLRLGGRYVMVENTFEGFEALNSVRRDVNLPNIKLHDWHNYFLHYDKFMEYISNKFVVEKTHNFNLYYLLTRVYVNMFASFEGYGLNAKKDEIFDLSDDAARRLYKIFNDKIKINIDKGESFGPIQGFVLRKIG